MTTLEAKQALARKLNIDYSQIANNGLFTDADLQDFVQTGVQKAWDYHDWDFAEGAKSATLVSGDIASGHVDYPQDMVTGGAKLLVVNGKEFPLKDKKIYADYRKFLECNPTAQDKIWSEYKRMLFMNMNACQAGQVFDVYGKLRCNKLSADTDLLPFSPDTDDEEDSGNRAIIDLAYAEALSSEKIGNPVVGRGKLVSEIVIQRAYEALDIIWKPMADFRANQTSLQRPFFSVPNFFPQRNGSSSPPGNFNIK